MAKSDTAVAEAPTSNQGILDEAGEGFTFDMSGQEADAGFPVLDAGVYDLSVDSVEYKNSQSSGHPMWAMRLAVTGPGDDVAEKKVVVRYYQSFKPDQMGRAKLLLQRLGKDDLANSTTFNPKQIADDAVLVGQTCRARLKVRNDETYGKSNEIATFLPAGAEGGAAGSGGFSM
jgi:hypothetical protein